MYYNLFGSRVYIGSATWIFAIILVVLYLIAGAKILKKGGDSGWKILIPIYGGYCLYKISNSEGIFWGSIVVSVLSGIISRIVASSIVNRHYYGYVSESDLLPLRIITIITGLIIIIMQFVYSRQLADSFGKGTVQNYSRAEDAVTVQFISGQIKKLDRKTVIARELLLKYV